MKTKRPFKEWVLDILYPRHVKCIFCGGELNENANNDTCENCAGKLPYIKNPCPKCGNSMANGERGVCFECKTKNYEFEQAVSVFEYVGLIEKAVHNFKYNYVKPNFEPFGEYMSETLAEWGIEPDIITYVPMLKKKQKQRGFNQAELLARYVAESVGVPCAGIVEKIKENLSQASLNYISRQENIKDCFAVRKEYCGIIRGATVLLIDDIFTTGATCNEVSRILKLAGVEKVFVLTLAHTTLSKDYSKY